MVESLRNHKSHQGEGNDSQGSNRNIWQPVIKAIVRIEMAADHGTINRKAVREKLEAELLNAHRASRKAAPEFRMPPSIELLKECEGCGHAHLRLNLWRHSASGDHFCDSCSKAVRGRKQRGNMYRDAVHIEWGF